MKKWIKHMFFSCLLLTFFLHLSVMDASADASYQLRLDGMWMSSAQLPNTYRKQEVAHNYSFTLSHDSLVTFTSRRDTLENAAYSIEKNGKSYIGGYLDNGLDNSITVALNAGTYTLKIQTKKYWEYSGSYQVKALATALNTSEKEPNGDSAIAMTLASDQTVKSLLSVVDDTNDWYTFTVSSASKVSVSITVLQGALTFEVYGSDLQKVHKDVFWYYNDAFTASPSTKTVTYDLDAGRYYIRCYSWDTDGFNKNKTSPDLQNMALYTVQWNRKIPVTSITLSGTDNISVGSSTTFSAFILPSDASNQSVKWSSSNQDVAVVDSNGKVTGINAGSAVIFAVAADGSGVTQSRSITVTSASTGGSPSTPVTINQPKISKLVNKSTGIQLSWNKISNASGYQIYRKKNTGAYTKIASVKNKTTISYTDTSVTGGNTYTYKIRAYYTPASGSTVYSSYSSEKKGYFIGKVSLSTVKNAAAGIKITWKKVSGAASYQIYRKTGSGSYQKIKTISGKHSYTDTNVSYKKKYSYKIRAYSKKSSTTYYSTFSTVKSVTCTKAETDVSKMKVSLGYSVKRYSGSSLKPSVTVKNEAKTLKSGTDYTVIYSNNVNTGLAKVTIRGKGAYTGTIVKTFQITSNGKKSTQSGSCGANADWVLIDNTLYIYGRGDMDDYEGFAPWYKYNSSIKKIEISSGITSIGASAFWGCTKATSVSIPNTVTSIKSAAFENCPSLLKVTIPDKVTVIEEGAFCGCSKLKIIKLGNGLKSIGSMAFDRCSSLTEITIPDKVTAIKNWAFSRCSSLKTVKFGSSLETIGASAFEDCTKLKTVKFGSSLKAIGTNAFHNCSSLTSITFPGKVTSIEANAFLGCQKLSKLTFKGKAPQIAETAFLKITARIYYPKNKSGWTSARKKTYGGALTWTAV